MTKQLISNIDRLDIHERITSSDIDPVLDDPNYKYISDKEKMDKYIDVFEAAMNNDVEAVDLFYSKNPEIINSYSSELADEKTSLLGVAVLEGSNDVFDFLIEKGANYKEVFDYEGQNLLHDAAAFGHFEIFKKLVKLGVDVNQIDNNGNNILHSSSYKSNKNIAQYIIENIDDNMLTQENHEGKIPLECINNMPNSSEKIQNKVKDFKKYIKPLTELKMKDKFSKEVDLLDNKPIIKPKMKI